MQMACHPATADLRYVDKLTSTPEYATTVKSTITEEVIPLAMELAQAAAAAKEDGSTTPGETAADQPAAKSARQAAPPGSVHPMFKAPTNNKEEMTTSMYASLGRFGPGGDGASEEPPPMENTARAELT